jgi:hypothetical protein
MATARLVQKSETIPLPSRPEGARVVAVADTHSLPHSALRQRLDELSFADLVRAAQETLRGVDVVAWALAILARSPKVFEGAAAEKSAEGCRRTETAEIPLAA